MRPPYPNTHTGEGLGVFITAGNAALVQSLCARVRACARVDTLTIPLNGYFYTLQV